ncbi:hypothetical protein [Burkholderia sp. BCC1999]|uniref:DUF7822 domain-containing protein n=1 Tax=Burkholderia sp. BCC1999 TaxID=2817448 RepID=UPI002AC35502|nr:hypothetical protein [Burkholderia sp. BCC1999]
MNLFTDIGANMANRSYLYSLGNRPTSYEDRPETIAGLSEWAYDVPFMYRLLMSCDPRLCASLVSDGLDGVTTPLHAISSPFLPGFERVTKFVAILRILIARQTAPEPAVPAEEVTRSTFAERMRRWVGRAPAPPAPKTVTVALPAASGHLSAWLDETIAFLEQHRDQYLLLETIELDLMSESDPDALRRLVEAEIDRCLRVGAAFDALPSDPEAAARVVQRAGAERTGAPLDAFFGLRFDDDCDSTRTRATEHPLGLQWSDELYFSLFNRDQFAASRSAPD